ncbi:MAG: 50S ribosomal protein L18 [Bacteroidia bacterium]|jgi:large subunit ribosomal protein L18|nr:50S ribosomal protein L18 [Bacteroidia bacterium]
MALNKKQRRERIKLKIRKTINGTASTPRLSVFRSNSGIYAQLIDDKTGKTILSAGSDDKTIKDTKANKVDKAKAVGKLVAEKATTAGISTIVFDRNGYLYHGRIKSLADGAREAGLKF